MANKFANGEIEQRRADGPADHHPGLTSGQLGGSEVGIEAVP
jgi:hypothetical protein